MGQRIDFSTIDSGITKYPHGVKNELQSLVYSIHKNKKYHKPKCNSTIIKVIKGNIGENICHPW